MSFTVIIPDSVTNISQGAIGSGYDVIFTDIHYFEYYDIDRTIIKRYHGNSTNIIIPDNVTSIGPSAFKKCCNIEAIEIPKSVVHIWEEAFTGCVKLHGMTIPPSVVFIGKDAFKEVINISNNSEATGFPWGARFIVDDFEYADADLTILKRYLGRNSSISIRDTVRIIAPKAFEFCYFLKSIIIPPSVTQIVENAFTGCNELKDVKISSPINFIGENTYRSKIVISTLKYLDGDFEYADAAKTVLWRYSGCSENVTIPDTVTIIAPNAFMNRREMQNVTIPQSVTQIWENAFANCDRLRDVIIPGSVRYVGKDAFENVANVSYSGVANVGFPWGALQIVIDGDFVFEDKSMTHLLQYRGNSNAPIIPSGVTRIGHEAFKHRNNLSIIIPSSITKIEENAFIGCDPLHIYSSGQVAISWPRTSSCYEYADEGMTILKKYHGIRVPEFIPSSITQIEPNAFEGYTFTKPYNFSSSGFPWGACFRIGDYEYADAGKTILKRYHGLGADITIPNTVKTICSLSFCHKYIRSVLIPSSVMRIEASAFVNCPDLNKIELPDSDVLSISDGAFVSCSKIQQIVLGSIIYRRDESSFYDSQTSEKMRPELQKCFII